jgi:hypothetical protein
MVTKFLLLGTKHYLATTLTVNNPKNLAKYQHIPSGLSFSLTPTYPVN